MLLKATNSGMEILYVVVKCDFQKIKIHSLHSRLNINQHQCFILQEIFKSIFLNEVLYKLRRVHLLHAL